jgi:hypothetical protein
MSELTTDQKRAEVLAERKRQFTRGAEHDLIRIGGTLATHLHDRAISRIVFIDQGARAGHWTLIEAWRRQYPELPLPEIYFVNPLGLNTSETETDSVKKDSVIMPRAKALEQKAKKTDLVFRPKLAVHEEFLSTFARLCLDKDAPVMVFDTCQHSGLSTEPVLRTLRELGFSDIKLGLASDVNDLSGIRPDFVALKGEANGKCYPFGTDSLVTKEMSSVFSSPNSDEKVRRNGKLLRKAVKDIFEEKWGTLRFQRITTVRD